MIPSMAHPDSLIRFEDGARVMFVKTCLPGDTRWLGKRGKVIRTLSSGAVVVRFGSFWNARVEYCFPEELTPI